MRGNSRFFEVLKKDGWALASATILLFWTLVALAPLVVPSLAADAMVPTLSARLALPCQEFWLGADPQGYSVAIQIINGARTSLLVSALTLILSLFIGIPMGAAAGYFGGITDNIISRIIDILMSFPPLILPIAISACVGGGLINVVFVLSMTGWIGYARLVRGQFLSLRERDFVKAARSLGATNPQIMFKHILPNTLSPLAVQASFALASVIVAEAGLAFLGLGVSGAHISWGGMLNEARSHLSNAPHLALIPAVALFSVVAALNFLGEAMRLALDPKSRESAKPQT